ncbi:LexA family protein [Leptospira santarosai]|uniref:LexA family protein n=1 Tax=Leptospira santarosai TaxID=28183 RepID=UPI002FC27893
MYIIIVQAGFPSPAKEYLEPFLNIASLLIENPNFTFYGRIVGDSMYIHIYPGLAHGF